MIIDIIVILFIVIGFWLGFTKGIARTLLHVITYIIALILTLLISPWVAEFLSNTLPVSRLFALIFGTIGIFILLSYLLHYLTKRWDAKFKRGKRSTPSKILGGIVMLFFSILICGLLLGAFSQMNQIKHETKQKSISYPYLKPIPVHAQALVETFKPIFRNYWEMMQETIQQTKSKE